jgi:NadR type nicotinamide-nucleotide adenylyltransferase
MTHGLVIGKFYPPHAGHHHLIRSAAAACEAVSVVVMAARHESIPLAARVAWLRDEHGDAPHVRITGIEDDLPMDLADPALWEGHVALMKQALAAIGAPPVTAVFTSETYGAELARRFAARAVTLDPRRSHAPISGTQVRADPVGRWSYLSPAVRAGLAVRIVVVGAESTGTTTLALALAERWRAQGGAHALTAYVAEYGRAYTANKLARAHPATLRELEWTSDEFEHIAQAQIVAEDLAARAGGPVLVCDTDAFATAIWHERYVGRRSPQVMRLADTRQHALYLLTGHQGVPFEQDGLRDGESIREWMSARFAEALRETGREYLLVEGDPAQRLAQAWRASRAALEKAWCFAAP